MTPFNSNFNESQANNINIINRLSNSDDWKDRSTAALLFSKVDDVNELRSGVECMIMLLHDKNLIVRANMIRSLRKLMPKYSHILKPLIPSIYILANFENKSISRCAKSLLSMIPPQIIKKRVVELTNNLYSENGLDRVEAIWGLFAISTISPEYVRDSLPELLTLSIYEEYELLRICSIALLEELDNKETKLIFNRKNMLLFCGIKSKYNLNSQNSEEIACVLMKMYFSTLKSEDLEKVLEFLNHNDYMIKLLSVAIIGKNANTLIALCDTEEIERILMKLIENLNSSYTTIKAISLLSFARILSYMSNSKYTSKFLEGAKTFLKENFILKACALGALSLTYKKCKAADFRYKIKKLVEDVDMGEVIKEHLLCYFMGISLLIKLYGEDVFNILNSCIHPCVDDKFIENLKQKNPSKYKFIFKELKNGLNSSNWICRNVSVKLMGNMACLFPNFVNLYTLLIKNHLLTDNMWITRLTSVWVLRVINHLDELNFSKKDYLDILEYVDDYYWEVRFEYIMFYIELLNKHPEILKDEKLKNALISSITTKYLIDKSHIIRKMCKFILQKIPEMGEILEYFNKNYNEKLKILQSMIENPMLRKSAFMRLKTILKRGIKDNNEELINRVLEFINGKYYKEMAYILHELVLLYNKHEIAKEIVDTIKSKHPGIVKYREDILFTLLGELLVIQRKNALKELKDYTTVGFPISKTILYRLKKMVVYDVVDEDIIQLTIKILEKVGDEEAKQLIKERKEIISGIREYTLSLSEILQRNKNWRDVYALIEHTPEEYITHLENDSLLNLINLLREDDGILLKIRVMDSLLQLIEEENPNIMNFIDNNYNAIFNTIHELINHRYFMVSKNSERLMRLLLIKKPSLFNRWILSKTDINNYIPTIKKFLNDTHPTIKMEMLNVVEHLLNLGYEGVNTLLPELLNLIDDEKWAVKRRLISIIPKLTIKDEDIDNIICKCIDALEKCENDFVMYILRLLNQLPPSKRYAEDVVNTLNKFIDNCDFDDITNSILEKYNNIIKGENND
ncbi:hypothetical protein [Methanotorris formicicus]|uniref:Condensin complex subunit 1 C-terminal domain-containing protein n=1 Tax=Methanotorris formicicus Mc-S-70 TaxID=647171 RepID=H1KZG1_9EURY|nr:hypothetical protein [Methanotorris formicicus]EHP85969.1 hypothetical protein MetfoDRAFT_1184 [Methanotorris formicicus Mc-S-70]